MPYTYTPVDRAKYPQLPDPVVGELGHFDNHKGLEDKAEEMKSHVDGTLTSLVAHINNLESRIAALEAKIP